MEKDPNIWLIVGDLGYKVFDNIRDRFPERFLNPGAAEQAMMGIAVGLALEGKKPFVYSITPFLLYRAFETIRNYISHESIPVRLVGSGRDQDYKHDGWSHDASDAKLLFNYLSPQKGEWISGPLSKIGTMWPDNIDQVVECVQHMVQSDKPSFISLRR